MKPYTAFVVSETHWDRAWYATFEQFRYRLVRTIDGLIQILDEVEDFHSFTLDGQTVVIEDYIEIRPERRADLARLVRSGRLMVGPWYVLPDEFLVSGEALVRNLLIGSRIAGELGSVMQVGYVPDPFGHIAQLPQILRGFGIDSFIFTRGLGDEAAALGTDFLWLAPDGETSVLAVHQIGGYANLYGWGLDSWGRCADILDDPYLGDPKAALEQVNKLVRRFEEAGPTTNNLLFNNGVDHIAAQAVVPAFILYVNAKQSACRLVHGTFADYVAAVRSQNPSLASFQGELHRGKYHQLLSGVYSARMYLKQANHEAQTMLEKYVEPIAALAWFYGADHPGGFLDYAWRTLLKNHPHDDICGCSVDRVHQDMEARFRHVMELGGQMLWDGAVALAAGLDTDGPAGGAPVAVFNPLPFKRDGVVESLIYAAGQWEDGTRLAVLDHQGRPVPGYGLVRQEREQEFGRPLNGTGRPVALSFLAKDLPSCGMAAYYLAPAAAQAPLDGTAGILDDASIENEFFHVAAGADGRLTVTDRRTGHVYPGLHYFEDTEDAGDEYDYSPAPRSLTVGSKEGGARIQSGRDELGRAWLEIGMNLEIPAALAADRRARGGPTVALPVMTRVTLTPGLRFIDCVTEVDNRAHDHRLRVIFQSGIQSDEVMAESKFDVVRRPVEQPAGADWVQPPVPTQHQDAFVSLSANGKGLAVLNRGLPEYEARRSPEGIELCLTLFRSVGWLSRGDLLTRKGHAGPFYAAPGAQCQGRHRFHYAILPHDGLDEAGLARAAQEFTAPPAAYAVPRVRGGRGPAASFLSLTGDGLILSSVKKAASHDLLVVRIYNPNDHAAQGFLRVEGLAGRVRLLNLAEEEQGELPVEEDGRVRIVLRAKGILTVGVPAPAHGGLHPRLGVG